MRKQQKLPHSSHSSALQKKIKNNKEGVGGGGGGMQAAQWVCVSDYLIRVS